jgi:hypothetical protein
MRSTSIRVVVLFALPCSAKSAKTGCGTSHLYESSDKHREKYRPILGIDIDEIP